MSVDLVKGKRFLADVIFFLIIRFDYVAYFSVSSIFTLFTPSFILLLPLDF